MALLAGFARFVGGGLSMSSQSSPQSIFVARMAAAAVAVFVACSWRVDPDLWGHLRFGLDAIRDRQLESVDPYSFTSDVPWINHEWLSEVSIGLAYLAGGMAGLWLLKASLVAISFLLMTRTLRFVEEPARWWLQVAAMSATAPIATTLRPQLWTLLALSILLATMNWSVRRKILWWPAMFALWANSHGGWIVGIGVLGAWTAGVTLDRRDWRSTLPLWGLTALCLLGTLLTPYDGDLWTFMWGTVGLGRDIEEWRAVWEGGLSFFALWTLVALTTLIVMRRTSWSWAAVLPVFMLGFSSVKVVRLIGLFGICMAFLLGPGWRRTAAVRLKPELLILLWFAALMPAAVVTIAQSRCLTIGGRWSPDLEAASALTSPSVQGRLMVPFNWGQFAIWHFSPRLKVSMDGRRETVYSHTRLEQQVALDRGDPAILTFIEEERPEYVWLPLPEGSALAVQLRTRGYRQDVATVRSTILTRSDLPHLSGGTSVTGCFP